jgi:betaine-aldehyde dehydrogenase
MEKISNFINGKSVQSSSGETTQIIDPSTGKVYAEAPKSNQADIDSAMNAAATAFEEWSRYHSI